LRKKKKKKKTQKLQKNATIKHKMKGWLNIFVLSYFEYRQNLDKYTYGRLPCEQHITKLQKQKRHFNINLVTTFFE
jgi:hypothetical protein